MTRADFIDGLFNLAKICEFQLDKQLAKLYADLLDKYGWDRVFMVLRDFQIMAKKGGFPAIGDFVEIIDPPINEKQEAIEAANRIINAVGKYGHTNPEAAKKYIGSLGWLMVDRFGGWESFARELKTENNGIVRAQLRELGETLINREKQGCREIPPAIEDIVKPLAASKDMKKITG